MKKIISTLILSVFLFPTIAHAAPLAGTIRDIQIADKTLWACGDRGLILKSEDSGKTWKKLDSKTDGNLEAIISDGNRVWFVGGKAECGLESPAGNGVIISTTDRGETFQKISSYKTGWLYGGTIVNSRAIVVGQSWGNSPSGMFYSSTTGSKWSAIKQRQKGFYSASTFKNPKKGFAVGKGLYIKSINNLASEKSQDFLARYNLKSVLRDVASLDDKTAIAVGDNGFIAKGTGNDWVNLKSSAPRKCIYLIDFEAVDCFDDFVVAAGGLNKKIFISSDKGKKFKMIDSPANSMIRTVKILPDFSILIGCDNGQIWRLDKSEKDWKLVTASLAKKNIDVMFIIAADDISNYPAIVKHAYTVKNATDAGLSVAVVYASCRKYNNFPKDQPLRAAAINAGASSVIVLRDFFGDPRNLSKQEIIKLWAKNTDIKGDKFILEQISAAIRLYKPKVVVTSCDISTDTGISAENALVAELAQKACKISADASKLNKFSLIGLTPHKVDRIFEGKYENSQSHLPWKNADKKINPDEVDIHINGASFPAKASSNIEMLAAKSVWMLGGRNLLQRPRLKTGYDSIKPIDSKIKLFTSRLKGCKDTRYDSRHVSEYSRNLAACFYIKKALFSKKPQKALEDILPIYNDVFKVDGLNPHILLADRAMLIWWQLCEKGEILLANELCYKLAGNLGKDHPLYNMLLVYMTSQFCSVEYILNTSNLRARKPLTKKEMVGLARRFVSLSLWSSTGAGYFLRSQLMLFLNGKKAAKKVRERISKLNFGQIWTRYSAIDISSDPKTSSVTGKQKCILYKQNGQPVVDGRLNEKFWRKSCPLFLRPSNSSLHVKIDPRGDSPIVNICRVGDYLMVGFTRTFGDKFEIALDSDIDCWNHLEFEFSTKGKLKAYIANRIGPKLKLPSRFFQFKRRKGVYELAIPIACLGNVKNDLLVGFQMQVSGIEQNRIIKFQYQTYPHAKSAMMPEYFGLLGLLKDKSK